MAPVDLTDLQRVVEQYAGQHAVAVGAIPLTAAALTRTFVKSKVATGVVVASGTWLAIQELSVPMMKLIQEQFGNLQSITGMFHG